MGGRKCYSASEEKIEAVASRTHVLSLESLCWASVSHPEESPGKASQRQEGHTKP